MKTTGKYFPFFVVSLGILWLVISSIPPSDPVDGFHLQKFAAIPVQENGRLMPFDTFARTKLMVVSHRQAVKAEVVEKRELDLLDKKEEGRLSPVEAAELEKFEADRREAIKNGKVKERTVSALEWALGTMLFKTMKHNSIDDTYMFRIDNDQVLAFLDLKPDRQFGLYFRMSEFVGNKQFWERVGQMRANKGPRKDDILEVKLAELWHKIEVIHRLAEFDVPFLVPPKVDKMQDIAEEKWLNLASAAEEMKHGNGASAFLPISQMLLAYARQDAAGFNRELDRYMTLLNDQYPHVVRKMQTEIHFNNFAPYYQCIIFFVCVMVMSILSWVGWQQPLRRGALSLGLLTMIVYTWTLFVRIQISGYAPVTNLYSSAIFIGWGCAGLCLMLELILRNGIGNVVAGATGVAALIIAHNLLDGDSMGKVVAVLESNFWLSTHVICITMGYTATFVAGSLGIAYVFLGKFVAPQARREKEILLGKVLYGVVCFAMFLSFVGTVLGGIWADQSWGRFWGWDPKENGALLIVIWNAIILHARWGGMVKARGVAMLAIFGNVVTAWSWFGTNFLGVGLHSYGFAEGGQARILYYALSQLAIIAFAAAPIHFWQKAAPDTQLAS
jgi:ABC-type transport system involved in cytochrome c biogenesis permease subunit